MSYENSNDEFPFPQYSLPSPFGDIFNNYSSLGQENYFSKNSVEFTTNAFENGAPAPLEIPSYSSQAVDDYSLHHIFSTGSQYCANLKKENYIHLEEGNPSSNYMKPIPPMLVEQGNPNPNELHGGCYVGGTVGAHNKSSSMYPEISRYMGNLETFLRGSPRPQQIEGGCKGTEKSVWTRIMERSKLHGNSSSRNFVPKYYNDELKEVSKDEYWISLQSKKSKDISNLGVSTLSVSNSGYSKRKSIQWSAQVCRDAQASNIPSIDSNIGTQNWMQTSNTTGGFYSYGIQQGGENQTFQIYENNNFTEQSPQLYQGCQNSALATNPSFNLGNGNGMENGNGNGNGVEKGSGEGSLVILDSEEDYSAIWEDLNPLQPIFDDGDCYIFPDSQNKAFENHDYHSKGCTNQVIDTGCGQKVGENSSDDFVKGLIIGEGNPNPPQSTVKEYVNVYSTMGGSVEGLDLLKQDHNEVSLGSEWANDFLLATGILRDDN